MIRSIVTTRSSWVVCAVATLTAWLNAAPTVAPPAPDTASARTNPCASALFCDDFEDDVVGQAPGSPWRDETRGTGATVRVDAARAFSGRQSVHVATPKGASYRRGYFAIHQPPVFPAAAREMHGRAMMWLESAPITPAGKGDVHWTFVQGEGRSANDTYNSIYRYGGQHQAGVGLMANFETTPPTKSDCWQHSASRMPVGRWTCVEWHFAVASNEMQFWLDGQELMDIHVVDHAHGAGTGCLGNDLGGQWLAPPAFQSLYLGWERYQDPQNDGNLWIDDVVISKSRAGCPTLAPATVQPATPRPTAAS